MRGRWVLSRCPGRGCARTSSLNQPTHILLGFEISGGSHMHATRAAMVRDTKHLEVRRALHPGADLIRVRYPRIVRFEPRQIHAVLQRELDVAVVQFERLWL